MTTDAKRAGDILSGYLSGMLFGGATGMAAGTGMPSTPAYLGALALVVLGVLSVGVGIVLRRQAR